MIKYDTFSSIINCNQFINYFQLHSGCYLQNIIKLESTQNFKHYEFIINFIKNSIDKYKFCLDNLNVILNDLCLNNITINSNYTIYLNNIMIKFILIKDCSHKKSRSQTKKYIKMLNALIFENQIKNIKIIQMKN